MKSAVLFIIFKRPDTTKRVFERIREAQPPRLYVAADGPCKDRPDEAEKCALTRQIVENIDWPCEVHRLYRDENLGCGKGVSSAITWFFEHEEQGIIIEDDILPHIDFFSYCDEMLERYKDDNRIQMIAGWNYFYDGLYSKYSYYPSSYVPIWGWATWKRVWSTYEYDVNRYPEVLINKRLNERFFKPSTLFFYIIYKKMRKFEIDTWDYQFLLNQIYFQRYSVVPFANMIRNIGFNSSDATHTTDANIKIICREYESPYPLSHPIDFDINHEAERLAMINSGQYIRPLLTRIISKLLKSTKELIRNKQ